MKLSKEELVEELGHQQEMVRLLRRRRRERERQAAQYGLEIPPHIATEINALNEQIRERESEITKLETLSAESDLSLAEAEYRVLLAEGLSTFNGRLIYLEATRLESARLKSGLLPERARQLEEEVRRELCEETFFNLGDDMISAFSYNLAQERASLKRQIILNSSENQIRQNYEIMELTNVRLNRLFHVERQKVALGDQTPAHLMMDIEDLRREISRAFNSIGIESLSIFETDSVEDIRKKFDVLGEEIDKLHKQLRQKEELIEVDIDDYSLASHFSQKFSDDFLTIDRCIRLDYRTTARLMHERITDIQQFSLDIFYRSLLGSLKIKQNDQIKFDEFFMELRQFLENAKLESETAKS